jgi:hypothetical protein
MCKKEGRRARLEAGEVITIFQTNDENSCSGIENREKNHIKLYGQVISVVNNCSM